MVFCSSMVALLSSFSYQKKILFQQMKNNAVAYIVLGVVKARDSNVFYLISEFHLTLKCTGNE